MVLHSSGVWMDHDTEERRRQLQFLLKIHLKSSWRSVCGLYLCLSVCVRLFFSPSLRLSLSAAKKTIAGNTVL